MGRDPLRRLLVSESGGITAAQHERLRQLVHFIDEGPTSDVGGGLRKATVGGVFPTSVVWYHLVGVIERKLVEQLITWTGVVPTTIVWNIYGDEENVLATVTDTITYSGITETGRTRALS